jgi:hypothetical protein
MRRRLIQLGLFLLLGAIVNVAVAWGCAYKPDRLLGGKSFAELRSATPSDLANVLVSVLSRPASREVNFVHTSSFSGTIRIIRDLNDEVPVWAEQWLRRCQGLYGERGSVTAIMSGWPIPALSGSAFRYAQDFQGVWSEHRGVWAIAFFSKNSFGVQRQQVLPARPLWPGFAINTLFYAGILWLLFAAPFALRRRRRIKRGLCPGCAYPVGESDVCTECGSFVKPAADE